MTKAVILIHGLMTNSLIMKKIKGHMEQAGFVVYLFDYKTQRYSDETLETLHKLVGTITEDEVYCIGHSMGGLVARNYISVYSNPKVVGIVTIATPHNRSAAAHRLQNSLFKRCLGSAGDSGLTRELPAWTSNIALGCIAGTTTSLLARNLFMLLSAKKGPSDGTVFLDEAILPGCTDAIELKGAHTGLVFQTDVAEQCVYFCLNKKFRA